MKDRRNVTCTACGWTHFTVTPEHVLSWIKEWDELFKTKPKEWLEAYGITDKPPSPEQYYRCFRCGADYKKCRASTASEISKLSGSTIQPILDPSAEIPV